MSRKQQGPGTLGKMRRGNRNRKSRLLAGEGQSRGEDLIKKLPTTVPHLQCFMVSPRKGTKVSVAKLKQFFPLQFSVWSLPTKLSKVTLL